MASVNVLDILTEYEDGSLIYRCTLGGKVRLAKYEGMKLWLKENGAPVRMKESLENLHWLFELSTIEKASSLKDPVSK